jgi:predicted transcriptional regulator
MKPTNENLVLFTLAVANAGLTVGDLAFRTGKSYNTVKKILEADERVMTDDGYPTRYYMKIPAELEQNVIRFEYDTPKDGWVSWLHRVMPKISRLLRLDKTAKTDDIYKQAVVVEALAINLVQFARELKEHSDKPDWFTLMGGKEDDDT